MPPKRNLVPIKIVPNQDITDKESPRTCPPPQNDTLVEVAENVFISGAKAAGSLEELRKNKIDVIVSMIEPKEMPVYPEEFIYIKNPIADNASQTNVPTLIRELPQQIRKYTKMGKRVLVHCQMGISRAPTVVIAYMMHMNGDNYDNIVAEMRKKKTNIDPNVTFLKHLQDLHQELSQRTTIEF